MSYESLPLQFDRVTLTWSTSAWISMEQATGAALFCTPRMTYSTLNSQHTLSYCKGILHAPCHPLGMGALWSTQIDSNRNMTSFNYNATMWTGTVDVTSLHAELTIDLTDDPDPVPAGGTISYTATYENVVTTTLPM